MSTLVPRVVLVTRPTELEELIRRHGTRAQVDFFVKTRGGSLRVLEERHERFVRAVSCVGDAVPATWRRARVDRGDLPRFLFDPADIVVAIGQDGLVANLAKYLRGQCVLGVNPDPSAYEGVLVRHAPDAIEKKLRLASVRDVPIEMRSMVRAELSDGQSLIALNEIFIGQRTHQSARYRIRHQALEAQHCSSGVIVATGTGSTGWARSIERERSTHLRLPSPTDASLCFFAREVFPSKTTATALDQGFIDEGQFLEIVSEMNDGGVLFGDGIEDDRLEFHWGLSARIGVAEHGLALVT